MRLPTKRLPTKATLIGLSAAVLVAVAAPAALAHAAYKDSDPPNGGSVSSPPSQIRAEFTEPITSNSYLKVFDPCGEQVDNGDSNPSNYEMTVSMSADKAGKYVVEFAAQSIDSHITYGSFSFTSSGGAACAGSEPPEQPPGGGGGGGNGGGNGGGGGGGSANPAGNAGSGPATSSGGGTETVASGGGPGSGNRGSGGGATRSDAGGPTGDRRGSRPGGSGPRASADTGDPVAFQNTGDTAPGEPNPWDLPIGGVVMALVLCVMIGAAGGRVYAGIVAPPRR